MAVRSPVDLCPLSALVLLSASCGGAAAEAPPPEAAGKQTFADAVQMICDVDRLAGLSAEADPLAVGQQRTAWLEGRIDNPDGIYFRTMISVKGPEEQAAALREQAAHVGVARCALAESLEQHAAGGLSP